MIMIYSLQVYSYIDGFILIQVEIIWKKEVLTHGRSKSR